MQFAHIDKISKESVFGSTQYIILESEKVNHDNPIGEFSIPHINLGISSGQLYTQTIPNRGLNNVLNKDNLGTHSITHSNFIKLNIPKHLFTIKEITITPNLRYGDEGVTGCSPKANITYNNFVKGQKFIVTFINNKENDIKIIGVVE